MKHYSSHLYLLAGLWLSLVACVMGASMFLPPAKEVSDQSSALLYKIALNEELRRPKDIVVPETGRAIVADLQRMELALYEHSTLVKTFPILSRGREETFWETPTGKYAIQTKELKHLSSISGTWMPYSMQFYGNFFIHGWPTYKNGTPVPKGYSGGCIRLSTEDAREVYIFAMIGTKVFVMGGAPKDAFATSSRYYLRLPEGDLGGQGEAAALPALHARAFLVADMNSGTVLWERNTHTPIAMGGLISFPTALTALETVNQYKVVRMGELLLGKSVLRKHSLGAQDEVPAGTLIYPLLFGANDTAANVFAREHGATQFVEYMNQKASAIGMEGTHFSGVLTDDVSTTTAHDLFLLLRYVNASKRFLIDASLAPSRTLTDKEGNERYRWENKNPWLATDSAYRGGIASLAVDGSGSAMLLFTLPVAEFGERTAAFIVIDSADLLADVALLREFVASHFVFGVEREGEHFVRESEEPTPSLLYKAKTLLDLKRLMQENISYEREL